MAGRSRHGRSRRRHAAAGAAAAAVLIGAMVAAVGTAGAVPGRAASRPPVGGRALFTVQSWGSRPSAGGAPTGATASVPTWTGSFGYGGSTYHYTMVGTDPGAGSATTTVPTEIVPLKVVMADGITTAGSAPSVTGSPVFSTAAFTSGTTQLADAMQRSSFWSTVSTTAPAYHLLLGAPKVLATVTMKVPAADGTGYSYHGIAYANISYSWWSTALRNVITGHHFTATTLPVLVSGNTFLYLNGNQNDCCVYGYHGSYTSTSGRNTYAFANWLTPGLVGNGNSDVYTLSHEISEWAADPYVDNKVPSWDQPNGSTCYSDLLEVGDPVEALPTPWYTIAVGSRQYHPSDIAGVSWFSHASPSSQQNGKYSYHGYLTKPSTLC